MRDGEELYSRESLRDDQYPKTIQGIDSRLVELVRSAGKNSPEFRWFEATLYDFGVGTLTKMSKDGQLLSQLHKRGIRIRPRTRDYAQNLPRLIFFAVQTALPKFLQRQILDGGWNANGGASVGTFFVRSCLYSFATEHNRFCREESGEDEELIGDFGDERLAQGRPLGIPAAPDPESTAIARNLIEQLLPPGTNPHIILMFLRQAQQRTIAEIADELDISANAVTGAMRRYRSRINRKVVPDGISTY